jgi:hypothetical protein
MYGIDLTIEPGIADLGALSEDGFEDDLLRQRQE